jgi:hypothetical protein
MGSEGATKAVGGKSDYVVNVLHFAKKSLRMPERNRGSYG